MKFISYHLGVVVCSHVRGGKRPILLAVRYDDGGWGFTCGMDDHSEDEYSVVGVGHLLESDSTLDDIYDLGAGFVAERDSVNGVWVRSKDEDQ